MLVVSVGEAVRVLLTMTVETVDLSVRLRIRLLELRRPSLHHRKDALRHPQPVVRLHRSPETGRDL